MMKPDHDRSSGQIAIRPPRMDDAPHLFAAIAESRADLAPWMPDIAAVPSADAVADWITMTIAESAERAGFHFTIVDATTDRVLGGCGLTHLNGTHRFANVYYWVRSSQTRRGIASAATRALAAWGFAHADLQRVEIVVARQNTPSLRAAEKSGARNEGIQRNRLWLHHRAHDAIMFSLVPADFQ